MINKDKSNITIRILAVLLGLCVVIIIFLTGALVMQNSGLPDNLPDTTLIPVYETDEVVEIETPYCSLKYPAMWSDYIKYEASDDDDTYVGTFSCFVKDQEIMLFKVHFGTIANGSLLGYIKTDEKKIPFGITSFEVEPSIGWTEAEKNNFYAIKECVNDVIKSVMDNENYISE